MKTRSGKKIKVILSMALVCAMVVGFNGDAFAYSFSGWKLVDQITFVPDQGYGATSVSHMNDALYLWNSQIGKTLMKRDAYATHTKTQYPATDNQNAIYRLEDFSNTYVGQTFASASTISTGKVYEVDMNLNMRYLWANEAQLGKYDVFTVFLHEAGHVAGLGHCDPILGSAVMNPKGYTNYTKRSLWIDDKDGINYLYK